MRRKPEQSVDFDYDEVDRALVGEPILEDARAETVLAMGRIFDWLLSPPTSGKFMTVIAVRLIALAWVIDPERFGGASLRQLSESNKLGLAALSTAAAEASRRLGLANNFQKHDWRRGNES